MLLLSDIVLILHFCIVIFIAFGIFLIPIGYRFYWRWIANKKLRTIHCGMMAFVTLETLLGITCPLTSIENILRGATRETSFISYWIIKVIYWDLPHLFFLILYCICLGYIFLLWKIFPPQKY